MRFLCDDKRHLVCFPYSIEGLHRMATELGIGRRWFHAGDKPHYDIPVRMIADVRVRCEVVSSREILAIIKTGQATNG